MPARLDFVTVSYSRGRITLPWSSRDALIAEIDHLEEARPIVGAAWTDYTGLRALQGVNGPGSTGVAGLGTNGVLEYWDLTSGKLTTPVSVGGGWSGFKLAQ